MTSLEEYQEFVEGSASEASKENFKSRITTCFGLCTESGEACDGIKKHLFQEADWDQEEFIKELGDIMWYMAFACNTVDISLQEVIDRNVEKLKDRYKTGKFTREEFLKKERAKIKEKTKPIVDVAKSVIEKARSFFRRRSS